MLLELVGQLARPAAATLEVPPAASRSLEQRARRTVGAQGEVVRRPLVLEAQHKLPIAVADNRVRRRLAIAGLELAHRLADERAAHLTATDDREHVINAGQVEVGEVIEHEAHGNGQPSSLALCVGVGAQALERLAHKEARERGQALVHVVHGHEQRAALVAQGAEVDLLGVAKRGEGLVKRQREDVRRNDAQDARMHLLGARRAPGAAEERDGVAVGILAGQLVKHGDDIAVTRLLEHAHHRGHVPLPLRQRLEDVGDVARQVVGGGTRPKRVLPHVVARKERARDGDDVLRKRPAATPAHMVERVVAKRPLHRGEVEAIDLVAMTA